MAFNPTEKLTRDNIKTLPPLCTDGAWGTEMQRLGAEPGQMCDIWNIDEPDKVFSVAKGYVDAGADIILTNTFNSNRIVLEKHGLQDRAAELSRAGAELSKRAAEGRAYVFASIGPCGKMIMMGEITEEALAASSSEQAAALADGGADAIVIETQTDLEEARITLTAAVAACDIPVGVSFTFDSGANNDRTMMGVSPAQAYEMAAANGASFVGANCGAGIESFVVLAEQFKACGDDLPIWIKGNAGKPEVGPDGSLHYGSSIQTYIDVVEPLLAAGARFIGGCCGSTPEHISAVAKKLAEVTA